MFVTPIGNTETDSRKYEWHMVLALNAYETSVAEAKEVESDGGFTAEQNGGSSQGVAEAIYRLHATRLKCLIAAVNQKFDREIAKYRECCKIFRIH
jgi:hypothetical protein